MFDGIPDLSVIAHAPEWLSKLAIEASSESQRKTGIRAPIAQKIDVGSRNDFLFRRACALRTGGFSEDEMFTAIATLNAKRCNPPLSAEEVQAIAHSAAGYHPGDEIEREHPDNFFRENVMDTATLQGSKFDPIRWAVEKVLPAGLSILAGRPKTCKSWLAYDLALHMVSGLQVFGTYETFPGIALYMGLEDSFRRLQGRANKLLGGHPASKDCHVATQWPKLHEGGIEYLIRWLELYPTTKMVVIDTLAKIRRPPNRNANLYVEDYDALQGLQRLAQDHNVAVLLVHHTNKQLDFVSDPFEAISGSTATAGCADTLWMLRRSRDEDSGQLIVTGREVVEADLAMRIDTKNMRWVCEGDREDKERSEEQKEVLALLKVDAMTPKQLADELDRKRPAMRKMLQRMTAAGLVYRTPRGLYTLTQAGMSSDSGTLVGF